MASCDVGGGDVVVLLLHVGFTFNSTIAICERSEAVTEAVGRGVYKRAYNEQRGLLMYICNKFNMIYMCKYMNILFSFVNLSHH